MKIRYDPEVDALSVIFRETTVTTQEFAEGIKGEYYSQGKLVGLEILDAAQRLGDASTLEEVTLEGLAAIVNTAGGP
ncbi:MAG TPA: DUF2283 domain-containing protein [Terriglobales bacterium]|nr:DUF2283 domain-containing protein [Terriglobales bacterium]